MEIPTVYIALLLYGRQERAWLRRWWRPNSLAW
jgi:hypothetical protein